VLRSNVIITCVLTLCAVAAAVVWHFSSSGLAFETGKRLLSDQRAGFADAAFWLDRTAAQLRFGNDPKALADFLMDRADYVVVEETFRPAADRYSDDAAIALMRLSGSDDAVAAELMDVASALSNRRPAGSLPHVEALLHRVVAIQARKPLIDAPAESLVAELVLRRGIADRRTDIIVDARRLNDAARAHSTASDDLAICGDIAMMQARWADAESCYRAAYTEHTPGSRRARAAIAGDLANVLEIRGNQSEANSFSERAFSFGRAAF
jgi:hypothetical protein